MAVGIVRSFPRRRRSPFGFLLGALMVVGAVLLVLKQESVRAFEARLVRGVLANFVEGGTSAAGSKIYFGLGTDDVAGLSITMMCSTIVLVGPLLAVGATILAVTGVKLRRVVPALIVALVLVILCNVVRYVLAAVAYQQWGIDGFDLVHRYIGAVLVIAGFIAAVLLTIIWSVRGPRVRAVAESVSVAPEGLRRDRREDLRKGTKR